jgi:hypothetical protein
MKRDRVREVPARRKPVAGLPQDTAPRTHLDREPLQERAERRHASTFVKIELQNRVFEALACAGRVPASINLSQHAAIT